jgi:uncharacterized protein DUF5679
MADRTAEPSASVDPATPPSKKERRATARKLAALEAEIASTDKLLAKRQAQLAWALARRSTLTAKLARLNAKYETPGPSAYCLRERLSVAMSGAHPVMLANGRPATAGTCPSCGARLVRIGSV